MIPLDVFGSESVTANLLYQVRWRDGVTCLHCCSDRTVRNGSYREFQRYLCENCDRTFNDKTGTIFTHSKVALSRWLFSIYLFLRFNTSLRQLQFEINVTQNNPPAHRVLQQSTRRAFPRSRWPVEINEMYVSAGKKAASAMVGRARVACPRASALISNDHQCYSRKSWSRTAIRDSSESRR